MSTQLRSIGCCFKEITAQFTRRRYHDETLSWARSNPEVAQISLKPPSTSVPKDGNVVKLNTLEDYAQWRRWPHSARASGLHERTMSLCSHVLSAPLTLANFFSQIECKGKPGRICCVGARAEATLPNIYWQEFLLLAAFRSGVPVNAALDFVGPDISTKTTDTTIGLHSESTISLRWEFSGFLHDIPTSLKWDAYVLLNPGLGHDNLIEGWEPTLDRLVAEKKPTLLTAHSLKDAERDSSRFRRLYDLNVRYHLNPFASRITYEDPFDPGHIVRPNQFVALIFGTATQ